MEKINVSKPVAISIKELHKSYGKHHVLKGLNLEVYQGELFGFVGMNGVGKSTTIDCMIGAKSLIKVKLKLMATISKMTTLQSGHLVIHQVNQQRMK